MLSTESIISVISNPFNLTIIALTLVIVHYLKSYVWYHQSNWPPMPCRPIPFLGHAPFLKPTAVDALMDWKNRLGDVTSFYIGSNLHIAFSSYDVLKEAFTKKAEAFSERPNNFFMRSVSATDEGVMVGLAGPHWREHRNVSKSILRNFGMGKNRMADIIKEEVDVYLETLSNKKGQPQDPGILTNTAISNVICALLVGQRFDYKDEYFCQLMRMLSKKMAHIKPVGVLDIFPWMEYLPVDYFGTKTLKKASEAIYHNFSLRYMNKFKDEHDDESKDNFIKAFLRESKKRDDHGMENSLDTESLSRIIDMLFIGGSETTSITIQWAMIYSMNNPESQKKVYEEIKEVVGTERTPTVEDQTKLRYLKVFIMETQRLGSIAPFGLQHVCTETTEVGGYTIPKGATILPHLDAVLKNEKTWGDPLAFRPERFLDKEGNVVIPDELIPFGIGRRVCLGESLARMELFLFFSAIFQRFEILPEDPNNPPTMKPVLGLTLCPHKFKVRLVERV